MSKETSPVEASGNKLELPLDIRATAFQCRVWEAGSNFQQARS